jgi:hypothetical protein
MAQINKKLVTAVFLLIWIISVSFVDLLENLVQKPPLYRGSILFVHGFLKAVTSLSQGQ